MEKKKDIRDIKKEMTTDFMHCSRRDQLLFSLSEYSPTKGVDGMQLTLEQW
jgi:hypothetical protein